MRIYLSGKMSNRLVADVISERQQATDALVRYNMKAVDPAAAEAALWSKGKHAKISSSVSYRVMSAMVAHDLFLIRRSDALLYLTASVASEGSLLEVAYAQKIGIPVVAISPERCDGKWMGWLNVLVGKENIFPDIKSAVRYLHRKYQKIYEKNKQYFDKAIKNAVSATNKHRKKNKTLDK